MKKDRFSYLNEIHTMRGSIRLIVLGRAYHDKITSAATSICRFNPGGHSMVSIICCHEARDCGIWTDHDGIPAHDSGHRSIDFLPAADGEEAAVSERRLVAIIIVSSM